MPSRVIRGYINSSESLSSVSVEAELTFRALLMAVDDFGRTDARPKSLKAALFPHRDKFTPDKILGFVRELDAEGCVQLYFGDDGRPYLQLTGWEKHRGKGRRGQKSLYPEPSPASVHSEESEELRARVEGRGSRGEGRGASRTVGAEPPPSRPKAKLEPTNVAGLDVDLLPLATAEKLLAVRPRGGTETPETLAAWFAWAAPRMRSRGLVDCAKAAGRWWTNVRRDEIEAAREWVAMRRLETQRVAGEARASPPARADDDDFELTELFAGEPTQ
jgi:hypothetical protein